MHSQRAKIFKELDILTRVTFRFKTRVETNAFADHQRLRESTNAMAGFASRRLVSGSYRSDGTC
jgi:hypothetical protein